MILKEILSGCECLKATIAQKKIKRNGILEIAIELDLVGYANDGEFDLFLVLENEKYGFIQIFLYSRIDEKNLDKKQESDKVSL